MFCSGSKWHGASATSTVSIQEMVDEWTATCYWSHAMWCAFSLLALCLLLMPVYFVCLHLLQWQLICPTRNKSYFEYDHCWSLIEHCILQGMYVASVLSWWPILTIKSHAECSLSTKIMQAAPIVSISFHECWS